MNKFVRGTQVIYIPSHLQDAVEKDGVEKHIGYPNGCQPGFVVSGPVRSTTFGMKDAFFVRYWLIEGGKAVPELRTKANSEITSVRDMRAYMCFPQPIVLFTLDVIEQKGGAADLTGKV